MLPKGPSANEAKLQIGDDVDTDNGEDLGKQQVKDSQHIDLETTGELAEEEYHQRIQGNQHIVTGDKEMGAQVFIAGVPDIAEDGCLHKNDHCRGKQRQRFLVLFSVFHTNSLKQSDISEFLHSCTQL